MRPSLFAMLCLACDRPAEGVSAIEGDLGGRSFDPSTVAFDELGPGPYDSAPPEERTAMVALVDAEEACPLLGPLHHLAWLRCETACEGLLAASWPAGEVRVLWLGIGAGEPVEGHYDFGYDEAPGAFTLRYRPVDLGRLEGQDQAACFAACDADPGFLSTGDDEGQWGDLEVTLWNEEALKGSFDVLLSQGGLSGSFAAARCEMGLY